MKDVRRKTAKIAAVAGLMLAASTTEAVEVRDLVGHDALFGRYAPAGNAARHAQTTGNRDCERLIDGRIRWRTLA